jgi:hypothetical protein
LRDLGAVIYEFDTAAIYSNDKTKIAQQKSAIIEFRPNVAVGTPHAGYLVQGGQLSDYDNPSLDRSKNLFIDELRLPVVLYWDHALTQAASYLLKPWPRGPDESQPGSLGTLRKLFAHPNIVHFFPDSGHAQELTRLGLGAFNEDTWYVQGVLKTFMGACPRNDEGHGFDNEVAFFGNLYLAASSKIPYAGDMALIQVRDRVKMASSADWQLSPCEAYFQAIADLGWDARLGMRLIPDHTLFWRFLFDELSLFNNGHNRLRMLQSCDREIAFFGNFNDPETNQLMEKDFRLCGALPYDASLAEAMRRTRVTIDIVHAAFMNGFSLKLMECFGAGGFALTNHRKDMERALGPLAVEICCDSAEAFAAKVEFFLVHSRRRVELSQEIGELVRRNYSAEALFARTLPKAVDRLKAEDPAS